MAMRASAKVPLCFRKFMCPRIKNTRVQWFVLVTLFISAAAITTVAVRRWRKPDAKAALKTLEARNAIPGVAEGEVVGLPKVNDLNGDPLDLGGSKDRHHLFAFISTQCPSCIEDRLLWNELSQELIGKNVDLRIISVDRDRSEIQRFVEAHELKNLSILYDPHGEILSTFKIKILPQYVLVTSQGVVLRRWNGIQRYDPSVSSAIEKLDRLADHLSNATAN